MLAEKVPGAVDTIEPGILIAIGKHNIMHLEFFVTSVPHLLHAQFRYQRIRACSILSGALKAAKDQT